MAPARMTLLLVVVASSSALLLTVSSLIRADDQKNEATKQNERDGRKLELDMDSVELYRNSLMHDSLEPDEFLDKLNELKSIFDAHEVPEELNSFKNDVVAFIKVSHISAQPCTDSLLKTIRQQVDEQRDYKSYADYSKHWREYHLSLCSLPVIYDTFENVQKMPGAHWRNVKRLEASFRVLSSDGPELAYAEPSEHADELIAVLKQFLQSKSRELKVSLDIDSFYREHVINPCQDWLAPTDRARAILDDVFCREDLCDKETIDKFYHQIRKAQICKYICDNEEQIKEDLHQKWSNLMVALAIDSDMCTDTFIRKKVNQVYHRGKFDLALDRLMSICTISIFDEMGANVDRISDQYKNDVNALATEFIEEMNSDSSGPSGGAYDDLRRDDERLRSVAKRFLDSESSDRGHEEISLEHLYQRHVIDPCEAWKSATYRALSMRTETRCSSSLCDAEWNEFFLNFIEKANICRIYLENAEIRKYFRPEQEVIIEEVPVKTDKTASKKSSDSKKSWFVERLKSKLFS